MKKIYSIIAGLLITVSVYAQAPQKMSYQAVIRNNSNALITSTAVGMKISVLQGTSTGTVVYSETQTPSTNANGLVSLEIGSGTPLIGTFAGINWANGPYFIKTETDPNGGTNYTISGTNELLSVPYALFSVNGTPGPTGPAGPAGATGPQGPIGLTGATGTQGPIGLTGAIGPQGPIGLTGATGAQGPTGLTGAQGPQGPIGLTGAIGPQGPIGLTGATGPQGPIGPIGLTGPAGAAGPQGDPGILLSGTAAGNTPYWDGNSWLVNSNNIFNNGGNVGIGTTTPSSKLYVKSTTNNPMRVEGTTNMFVGLYEDGAYRGYLGSFAGSATDVDLGTGAGNSAGSLHLTIQANPALSIDPNMNVGIGTTTPDNNRLRITVADATTPTGLSIQNNYTGISNKYGIHLIVNEQGAGSKYGVYSLMEGTAGDASPIYGSYLNAIPNGTGPAYGTYNYLAPLGTGSRYGTYNWVDAAAASTSVIYGSQQLVNNNGSGTTYGYAADVNKAAGQAGNLYGLNITADNDGSGNSYLLYGNSVGSTTGTEYGVYVAGEDINYFSNNVGIGTNAPSNKLEVVSNNTAASQGVIRGEFTGTNTEAYGVHGINDSSADYGTGVWGDGGSVGVGGQSIITGSGDRYGMFALGKNGADSNYGTYASGQFGANAYGIEANGWYGTSNNYGVYANGRFGNNSYGVHGTAQNGSVSNYGIYGIGTGGQIAYGVYGSGSGGSTTSFGGYFNGTVYTTGLFIASDRKLKTDIVPLNGALTLINRLNPSVYNYNTGTYKHMNLPEGLQYGFIADELQQVLPSAVKKTVQPAEYENHDSRNGKKLSDEVEFISVNYVAMVPILIAAVKEQQQEIEGMQQQIDELKRLIGELNKN